MVQLMLGFLIRNACLYVLAIYATVPSMLSWAILKSVKLQYIMLGCLDDGTNKSSTKSLMIPVLLLIILFKDFGHSKLFIFIFVIL